MYGCYEGLVVQCGDPAMAERQVESITLLLEPMPFDPATHLEVPESNTDGKHAGAWRSSTGTPAIGDAHRSDVIAHGGETMNPTTSAIW